MPLESFIHKRCLAWLNSQPGVLARKLHGSEFSVKGDCDLYGCYNGAMFLIELKQPGETSEPIQRIQQEYWRRAGAFVFEAHSLGEVKVQFEDWRYHQDAAAAALRQALPCRGTGVHQADGIST